MPSNNGLHVFGIRHHGPGSSRSLLSALDSLQPDIVLLEGPPDAEPLLSWTAHPDLQPPVAILIYLPDVPQMCVYYPYSEFSPEWQAIRWAVEHGIPVRFMDLPQAYQLGAGVLEAVEEEAHPNPPEGGPAQTGDRSPAGLPKDPIVWLAETAGYSDSERWWEQQIEQRLDGEGIFAAILELMAALRREVAEPEQIEALQLHDLFSPGEALREAYMRQTIRAAQREGFSRIAAVCGAWHAPALVEMPPARQDAQTLKGLVKVKVAATWVPWSYGRLSWDSGYGAGIESPGWYEHLWQAGRDGLSPTETSVRWMIRVAHLLRGEDLDAAPASAIEAVRLAEALAALRSHPLPGLPELNEAVRTVFCFGDELPLRLIREKLIISERLGSVPPEMPHTPLQADLIQQQKRLRLAPEASIRELDLDLRKPNDLERSRLLHRLGLLGIPWGTSIPVSGKSGTFHEFWRLQWQPELAVAVVEASLWGNTVLDAVAAFAIDTARRRSDLPSLTTLIGKVLLADLPETVAPLVARLDELAALDSDVGQLMDALPPLAEALRYGSVRVTDADLVSGVVYGMIERVIIGLVLACASLNDEAAALMYARLVNVHRAISLLQNSEHQAGWEAALQKLGDQAGLHGLIAGRCCRTLLDSGSFSPDQAARRMGLALSGAAGPSHSAAWVEGFLKDSGALLLHDEALWQVLDGWVTALPGETFTGLLPLLRRTFATFTVPERRQIGERARQGKSRSELRRATGEEFDFSRAGGVLPRLAELLGISLDGAITDGSVGHG